MTATIAAVPEAPTLEDARALAEQLAGTVPRVERILLFGSLARDKADPGSDIDLVVLLSDSARGEISAVRAALRAEARSATLQSHHCHPGDLLVRLTSDWEHASKSVTASLEAAIAREAIELVSVPSAHAEPLPRDDVGTVLGVPAVNHDVAATHLRGAAHSLRSILDAIVSPAGHIKEPSTETRELRLAGYFLRILESSHLAIELAAKALIAGEGGTSRYTHDLDSLLGHITDAQTSTAFTHILAGLRSRDGILTTWRAGIYQLDDWADEITAANAAVHAQAAIEAVRVATDDLAASAASASHEAIVEEARSVLDALRSLNVTETALATGPPIASAELR